jgi:hypothetical protein
MLPDAPQFLMALAPVRACAVLSLSIWFATAACGRLIAYF